MAQNILKATAHFNLRDKKAKYTLVYMVVNINHKQYKISTGMYVKPQQWDYSKEECIISSKFSKLDNSNNSYANEIFSRLNFVFKDFFVYYCTELQYCSEIINFITNMRKKIQDALKANKIRVREPRKAKTEKAWSFKEYMTAAIDADGSITDSSKGIYHCKARLFCQFLENTGIKLAGVQQIDKKLIRTYIDWLQKHTDCQTNTVNESVNKILTMLGKYAVKDELLEATDVDNLKGYFKAVKTRGEASNDEVALRDDEVLALHRYKCENKADELAKDVFVLACTVGQRVSDLQSVIDTYETINGRGYFHLTQKKTKATVSCPVKFQIADELLSKHHEAGTKVPSKEAINHTIKVIAKNAGLKRLCRHAEMYGTTQTICEKPLYEKLSTHTGRRTFITMLALRGFTPTQIQDYSGHSTSRMVEHYSKTTPMERDLFENLPDEDKLAMTGASGKTASCSGGTALEDAYIEQKNLDQYKELLCYIGVPAEEYVSIKSADSVARLFYKHEDELLQSGVSVEAVKGLFNARGKSITERKAALAKLLENARKRA